MANENKTLLSQREYAKHRGVSEQAVAKAIRTKRITATELPDGTKQIDPAVADKQWQENTFIGNVRKDGEQIIDEPQESAAPDPDKLSYSSERAKREVIGVRLAYLELQRREGRLVDLDKAALEFFNCSRTVRNAMLAIPDRMAAILAASTDPAECHKILTDEINQVLENLSNGYRGK